MDAQLDARDVIFYAAIQIPNELRRCVSDGVSKRNGVNSDVFYSLERFALNFRAPGVAVRIAESHGDVDHQAALCGGGFFF